MVGISGHRVALLFAALLLAAPLRAAAQPPEIEYAYPDQSVWTTRVNERGEPDNPLLRVASALFGRAGIPWRGKDYPATRMFNHLRDGTAQFSMLVKAPVLQECCLLSATPVTRSEVRVYRTAGKPPVRALEDLAGRRVITIRGYSYGGMLGFLNDPANRITNHAALKHDDAFAMLEAGRGDYLLDYAGPAAEVLATRPIEGVESDLLSRQDVFLVLSKSYPDAPAVLARLETILATLDVEALMTSAAR
ncbi:MAG TPA: amino acid ABC transporter [Azospirillum sp.]|nr:amino acid ABC transporter [Azospirillum sp.]